MLLGDQEIMTFNNVEHTRLYISPDSLKLLVLDGTKTMQILYLKDTEKITENSKTIPLESIAVSICWFKNSENIVVAYKKKFQIYNVLTPDEKPLSVECLLSNDYSWRQPRVVFDDRAVILLSKDKKLVFYDIHRRKFVA